MYTTLTGETRQTEKYTALNPHSLDKPSYYTTTHSGSPYKKEEAIQKKEGEEEEEEEEEEKDEGGVNMYLEVVPSVPPHSSRSSSPLELTGLVGPEKRKNSNTEIVSPDVLDGDVVDPMYEYVNADLGPI